MYQFVHTNGGENATDEKTSVDAHSEHIRPFDKLHSVSFLELWSHLGHTSAER